MHYKENLGATCDNCDLKGGKDLKACRQCANHDGMRGWEPAEGIKTKVFPVYSGPNMRAEYCRQVIEGEAV